MLTIRMQRRGRSGHAQFRVIVQDSRFSPKSGRVVAYVGSYDPHTKTAALDGEKISAYLINGAQPSDRVAKLLQKEGIKLPSWFKPSAPRSGKVRNPEKRRSTRPAGAPASAEARADKPEPETKADQESAETGAAETEAPTEPAEVPAEAEAPAAKAETKAEESDTETDTPAEPAAEEKPAEAETAVEPEAEKPSG